MRLITAVTVNCQNDPKWKLFATTILSRNSINFYQIKYSLMKIFTHSCLCSTEKIHSSFQRLALNFVRCSLKLTQHVRFMEMRDKLADFKR